MCGLALPPQKPEWGAYRSGLRPYSQGKVVERVISKGPHRYRLWPQGFTVEALWCSKGLASMSRTFLVW